jgi:hypothetical protein
MAQSPNTLYTKILSQFGFGYPLWIPEPSYSDPDGYRSLGVSIADVCIKPSDGSLDFLFNASFLRTHAVNIYGVPNEFDPLHIMLRDINILPAFFPPWTYIGGKCVKDVNIQLGVSTIPS